MLSGKLMASLGSIVLITLLGCGTRPSAQPVSSSSNKSSYPSASETPDLASGFGVVEAVDTVSQESSGGVGTATAAGGASSGHAVENRNPLQSAQAYRISLRMDNGTVQTLLLESAPALRVGDRVRISNGIIERM